MSSRATDAEDPTRFDRLEGVKDPEETFEPPVSPRSRSGLQGSTADVFAPGTRLAERYRILRVLGRGGMGVVYCAEDLKLAQRVALKFLPGSTKSDETRLSSLLHEVRIAREISHPNVCSVYDIGEVSGRHFISMKYVDGQDLASLLRQVDRLPREKGSQIARQICHGLAAAHDKGVLHRDLKPANLLIDRGGNALVTDFGLARLAETLRDEEAMAGTPAYMAPEQFKGRKVSHRTDIYSLGLVLYEMFTGRRPFLGRHPAELAQQHCDAPPPPPTDLVDRLKPALGKMILRCLAKAPGQRPTSALEVAEAMPSPFDEASGWRPAVGLELPLRANWTLEKKLGSGGFGEAWCAVHKRTQERRVFKFCYEERSLRTLKRETTLFLLLKEELGDRNDITRILDWNFDHEPYFIESEYTPGGDLIDWMRGQGGVEKVALSTRLEIVAQLGEALAAAHSVGVLHKDVKPANVLITTDREGRTRAKLTDFGIGLVTDRRRLREAGLTGAGMTTEAKPSLSGTRLYMAPELLEGRGATLETDVYALGVVLYQLVVGDFSRALVSGWSQDVGDEVLRQDIAEAVHRFPQKRLKAQQLAERLRSLDERQRKLESIRWDQREAEQARAALAQVRKRRKFVATAMGILLTFAVSISIQAWNIHQARKLASAQAERASVLARQAGEAAERASQETERARQAAAEAEQLSKFLVEVFDVTEPGDILDRSAAGVAQLRDQPELQAELMHNMGRVYRSLGRYQDAIPLVDNALRMKRDLLGPDHGEVTECLYDLGRLRLLDGEAEKAEPILREALRRIRDSDSPEPWRLAEAESLLGESLAGLGRFAEAEALLHDAFMVLRIELGVSAAVTQEALRRLVELYEAWRPAMAPRFKALVVEDPAH